jgi:hypothetical protein
LTGQAPAEQAAGRDQMTAGELVALHKASLALMHAYGKHRAIPLDLYEQARDLAADLRERLDDHAERDRRARAAQDSRARIALPSATAPPGRP